MIFQRSAACYDALYAWKDYEAEAARIERVIHERRPQAQTLLDVACGSGKHLEHLQANYRVEGLDLSQDLLAIARARLPGVTLHYGDMLDFELGRRFDVVTCLFSAIGYACTLENLHGAVARMAGHLGPGGLLIVEPWFGPDSFLPGRLDATFVDEPERKIARMNVSQVDGALSALDFHYMVGTAVGIEYFRERHELGLFTEQQYLGAFAAGGLEVEHDPEGIAGRGLYVATRG